MEIVIISESMWIISLVVAVTWDFPFFLLLSFKKIKCRDPPVVNLDFLFGSLVNYLVPGNKILGSRVLPIVTISDDSPPLNQNIQTISPAPSNNDSARLLRLTDLCLYSHTSRAGREK